ncbi:hypothetical protein [Glycomyces buryatensis]|uniref:Uncharacterized protein n=1 Tax=Glycomyces buryatensis TaxID=2570927 RepID=A0A4S8Q8N5_9ACTN|nr:hypothetical protein [Glycomyces buryatensis]THV39761.1 hypothetical protein FAB82_16720 [Glycomyces buryatensis]
MYDEDEAAAEAVRRATPETQPPAPRIDLDRVVRDGYRARARGRAVLGGTTFAGVAAVAGVLALTAGLLPGQDTGDDQNAAEGDEAGISDYGMAGYPYVAGDHFDKDEERAELQEAATSAYEDLLVSSGVTPADRFDVQEPSEEEIQALVDEHGITEDEARAQLNPDETPLDFGPTQAPGNYGQTWLRGYITGASPKDGGGYSETPSGLRLEAMLPGGWTAEPGPVTHQVFPQHLINDTGEFSTEELDDGRILMVSDQDCIYEVAIVYPNHSGLRASWDAGCDEEEQYRVDLGEFTDAALAMPEIDYDTSGLAEIDELIEVPTGWLNDPEWPASAESDANASTDAAAEALEAVYPGATLGTMSATAYGLGDPSATVTHSYHSWGTLPFQTTIDTTTGDVAFSLSYHLPGGWVAGIPTSSDERGPYLAACQDDFSCIVEDGENGVTWGVQSSKVTSEPENGEDWEPETEYTYDILMNHPDGWSASIWVQYTGDVDLDAEDLKALVAQLPAPVYDPAATPEIPE